MNFCQRLGRMLDRLPVPALDPNALPGPGTADVWDRCLDGVERAIELQRATIKLATADALQQASRDRDVLLGVVDAAMNRLDVALDHAQVTSLTADHREQRQELLELIAELDRTVEIARRVEARLAELER